MANYRKSFNFKTGLQVDNDNFVVNANGLVGIGTSIPENYLLNVYGDTRVTGVVTTGSLNAGVGTVTTLTASNSSLGVASVTSIQIAGGPVLTNLVGYAYSAFIDDGVGGISTTSRIGIGTTADSTARLKVLGDSIFTGNINASTGTVTATTFVGNVTGTATTATNLADGANITTGTISDDRLPDLITSDINSSGISTFTTLKLGSNIEMSGASGIITATAFSGPMSGAVTGNADTATALQTARDFSVSGDVATASAVSFDGTGNVDLAVTLSSSFDANTTGIITATGGFVGDVTGTATTATNLADGANITTGTISDDRLPDLITSNITGTATTATNLADGANITTGTIDAARLPDLITSNINISSGISTVDALVVGSAVTINSSGINAVSGIFTATTFVGDVTGTATTATNLADGANITTGTISNDRLPDLITSNINISSGISTFNDVRVGSAVTIGSSGIVTATTFVGNVTGTATTATALSGTPDITVGQVTSSNLSASGIVTATTGLNVGSDGVGLTALSTGNLGIGTTNPTSELLIRKSSGSLLEVVSDSGEAKISIGNSVGVGNSSGVLRFGNAQRTLDFVNRDTGNINMILHAGGAGINTGRFDWIYGQNNNELMSLTYDGNLGIDNTTPSQKLSVGGGATITGSVYINSNLTVEGSIDGNINYPDIISGSNLYSTSGITTVSSLNVTNNVDFDGTTFVSLGTAVGIGTTVADLNYGLTVKNNLSTNFINVTEGIDTNTGFVTSTTVTATAGFKSNVLSSNSVQIDVYSSPDRIVFTVLGVGSTTLNLF